MTTTLKIFPPVIGHRGACAYAPENTLVSFIKAAQLGIQWIEFDVMQAACGELIIFHDQNLERTTSGKGEVHAYPYAYLQTLDAGAWFNARFAGERIPTFKQVMDFLQDTKLHANVEIKAFPSQEEKLVIAMLDMLQTYPPALQEHLLFSSFSIDALQYLRQYAPKAMLGLLLHAWRSDWLELCNILGCLSIHINHKILSRDLTHLIKSNNKFLLSYTVNHPKRAKRLFSWGVDAVFSDMPDQILLNPA